MTSICIIGVYFGKLLDYFPIFLNSCKYNDDIEFYIITDQDIVKPPKNVEVINMSFDQFKALAQSKFGFKISLDRPYKICDYKPVFGIIFHEYIEKFDFWGHCDFDMIFGDLRKFFNKDILANYDKILPLGHLSLYRNNEDVSNRFKINGSLVGGYKKVFSSPKNFAFDETNGIYSIYKYNGFPMYDERVFADISSIHKRFRLPSCDKNYNKQIFSFDDGKILREYFIGRRHYKEEFIYIHIKKPKKLPLYINTSQYNRFFVTNSGFYPKVGNASLEIIEELNPYPGKIVEQWERSRRFIYTKLRGLFRRVKSTSRNTVNR